MVQTKFTQDEEQVNNNKLTDGAVVPSLTVSATENVDSSGTTTFIHDATSKVVERGYKSMLSSLLTNDAAYSKEQTIQDYLSKPVRLSSGAFTLSDSGNTIIAQDILSFIASQSNFAIWRNKFKGYYATRFTMVFRLVVNANRFQQGRYILAFCPTGGVGNITNTRDWYKKHCTTTHQVVQLPHAEIDLATESEVTLKIPMAMNQIAMPISVIADPGTNPTYDLGALFLRPYSALVAPTGSTVADYTIYMSLEDVELLGASTQSETRFRTSRRKKNINISNQEQDQANVGPLEQGFTGVSMVAGALTNIPLLRQFTGPVKWASDFCAGVCSKFGWCKPSHLAPVNKMRRVIFPNLSNTDGHDVSQILALSQENIVEVCEGTSGTDLDEMSFSFLTSIQNYAGTFSFSTSNLAGDALFHQYMCPADSNLIGSIVDNGKTLKAYGTIPFIANYFQYYRGTLCLRLKFVKTEFHSGRIAVAFFPQVGLNTFSNTYDDSAYVPRIILDLRENNEVEIEVPYISTLPYRNINDPYGIIYVFCVDPLVAPSSVSSTINVIVEVVGSKSLEFAVPANNLLGTYTPTATQAGTNPKDSVGKLSLGQSSMDEVAAAASCIGEKIVSFRSLIKRPTLWTTYDITAPSVGNVTQLKQIPVQLDTNYYESGTWYSFGTQDMMSVLGQCYALSRGGVRIKLVDTGANTGLISSVLYAPGGIYTGFQPGFGTVPANNVSVLSTSLFNSLGQNGLVTASRADLTGGVEVQVPQYNMTHSRINAQCMVPSEHLTYYNDIRVGAPNYDLLHNFSTAGVGYIMRSGADDFSLGYFVSIPTLA